MIAPSDKRDEGPGGGASASRRIYVRGKLHPGIRVPMREVTLCPTEGLDGTAEENEPIRVYDASGPWGDPEVACDVSDGLPPHRLPWIQARKDTVECKGRERRPEDDGYLSAQHEASRREESIDHRPDPRRSSC